MTGRVASLVFRSCLAIAVCAGASACWAVDGPAGLFYRPTQPSSVESYSSRRSAIAAPDLKLDADDALEDDGTRLMPASGQMLASRDSEEVPPPSMVENFPGPPPDSPGLEQRWTNPYEATIKDPYIPPPSRLGLRRFLPPRGIIPFWGPRTGDGDRFIGLGQPLYGASWLNRPLGASWFMGFMQGGAPIPGVVGSHGGAFGGYRFTWDYDYYYGMEARLGMGAIALQYPEINRPTATSDLYVADINFLYYPLGDARWRPYVSIGVGTTKISFYDFHDNYYGGVLTSMPYGVGLKWRWREWVDVRGDIMDNLAFGRGPFATMHNVSYTAGFEVRFGGLRRTYYSWNPSKTMW
jgi:hypothetical protein